MNPFGICTFDDLIAQGIPRSTISARCKSGRYQRLLPGVYSIGEPTKLARCFAVITWQPLATLSHRTAAWLRGWSGEPAVIEATVPSSIRMRSPDWLRLYRRDLPDEVVSESWSMPTVNAEQTLLDCIAVMAPDDAGSLVDERLDRDVSRESLELLRKKNANRRGNGKASKQMKLAAVHAASEPERLLGREFNARGFPLAANVRVGPYVCDFVDEEAKVIVEVDGREFHSEHGVFRSDRRRQNWLVLQGWLILRYAAYDVLAETSAVADEVIAVVRKRRRSRRTLH